MKRTMQYLVRTLAKAVAMVFLGWALGTLLPAAEVAGESTGIVGNLILPLVSAFVLAIALAYPISRSRLTGTALLGAVFLAVFGLMTVLTLVEAA